MEKTQPHDPVWTVGHSTRPIADFIALLQAHGIQTLADIRTIPRSRRNPQYNADELAPALEKAGIAYCAMKGLGGLRHARKDSVNTGWRNDSFRGYADYMQTPEFRKNLDALIALSQGGRTAIMCAEAVPWRCHRSLVADALTARGVPVMHIMAADKAQPHRMTAFARVSGEAVTYPPEQAEMFGGGAA